MLCLKEENLNVITSKYPTLIMDLQDIQDAFNFVHEVLTAEADALKKYEPTATATIARLEKAAYEVFDIGGQIDREEFNREDD